MPALQQRVIAEQDEKLEAHRKIIADLRAKLDDHEWNNDDEYQAAEWLTL